MKKIFISIFLIFSLLFWNIALVWASDFSGKVFYTNKVEILKKRYKLKYKRSVIKYMPYLSESKVNLLITRIDKLISSYSNSTDLILSKKEQVLAQLYALRELIYEQKNKQADNIL